MNAKQDIRSGCGRLLAGKQFDARVFGGNRFGGRSWRGYSGKEKT